MFNSLVINLPHITRTIDDCHPSFDSCNEAYNLVKLVIQCSTSYRKISFPNLLSSNHLQLLESKHYIQ